MSFDFGTLNMLFFSEYVTFNKQIEMVHCNIFNYIMTFILYLIYIANLFCKNQENSLSWCIQYFYTVMMMMIIMFIYIR